MLMTIKVPFVSIKFLFILVICLFALALERSSSFSRELDKVTIDYNVFIRESLKRNGALLDLSEKKIGDQGLKLLIGSNILKNVKPDKNEEIQLTNALKIQAKQGKVIAYKFNGKRFDCGSIRGYVEATNYFANKLI